ncbi:NADPH-dependent ferric siderophore reductase OS=Streptomyces violarus OX=67380 GN=FHS41_003800 PE=4 SV=1 [Streptomyces violarus]
MTTAVAAPFRFFSLQVVRTRRLPSLARVTFAGPDLHAIHPTGATSPCPSSCRTAGQPSPPSPSNSGTAGGRPGVNSPTTYGR